MKTIKVSKAEIEALKECYDDALYEVRISEGIGNYNPVIRVHEGVESIFRKILGDEFKAEQLISGVIGPYETKKYHEKINKLSKDPSSAFFKQEQS